MHRYHLSRVSGNAKTGPIPVSTTSSDSCPVSCPLRGSGCYGEAGPIKIHWLAVDRGERGVGLEEFCRSLKRLPRRQLWRYAQVGDLPGDGQRIDRDAALAIAQAAAHTNGFGYTHYDPRDEHNASVVRELNEHGLTINLSADNLDEVDEFVATGVGPVVTVLPADVTKPLRTPAGNFVAMCPASVRDDVTCSTCGICANSQRRAVIGFPAHGVRKQAVERVFWLKQATWVPLRIC